LLVFQKGLNMFLVCERVSSIQVFNNKFDGVSG